jgi:hypothetical protein
MPTLLTAVFITLALSEPEPKGSTPEDPPKPSEHRWRLHADISPAHVFSRSNETFASRSWVLGIPGTLSIGFGRMLGRNVMVGTRIGGELRRFTSDSQLGGEPWNMRSVAGRGWLSPYVEVRPLPDQRVQPFGLVEGGIGLAAMRHRSEGPVTVEPHRSFGIDAAVGGRVGLHAFVLPRLSIDADLGVRRQWSFDWRASPARSPADDPAQPLELQLAATVGLSGWW